MKCLVAVKKVIDPDVNIRVKSDNSGVETENVKMAVNPFDEIAIEEAVLLKEKNLISEILAVSIGDSGTNEILRQSLARGADRALLVETNQQLEPLMVAKVLKKCVEENDIGIVLMGKQAIDDDCNQTGQMLSTLLKWPQVTFASNIEFRVENDKKIAVVSREVDGGVEVLEVNLPAVITTDLRLNEPRYITLPNVMKAKQKPLEVKPLDDFGVKIKSSLQLIKVEEPAKRAAGIKLQDVVELIAKLKDEEKII